MDREPTTTRWIAHPEYPNGWHEVRGVVPGGAAYVTWCGRQMRILGAEIPDRRPVRWLCAQCVEAQREP